MLPAFLLNQPEPGLHEEDEHRGKYDPKRVQRVERRRLVARRGILGKGVRRYREQNGQHHRADARQYHFRKSVHCAVLSVLSIWRAKITRLSAALRFRDAATAPRSSATLWRESNSPKP
jgi:hypothetical protein